MPNIKSSSKRVQLTRKFTAQNRAEKTELKTVIKKFEAAVAEGNREEAVSAYKAAQKTVDHAVVKGLIHQNKGARKKSQMATALNNMA